MVRHNQLDVRGVPWPIKEGGREGAYVPGRQHFSFGLLSSQFTTSPSF